MREKRTKLIIQIMMTIKIKNIRIMIKMNGFDNNNNNNNNKRLIIKMK